MDQQFKDYYAALGVAPDADAQTIKQTYRKLARQYHPDVNPGDKQAEERFKAINEAYQVLGDEERRRKYDDLRRQYQQWQQQDRRAPFDWGQWQAQPGETAYTRSVAPEDLEDLFGAESPFSDFFSSVFGAGATADRTPRPRPGRDLEVLAELTLEEAYHGTLRAITVGERHIEARIPPGVASGSRVRLSGQGSPGIAGGPPGDLYLVVQIVPHPAFERENDDLTTTVPVDVFTAAAGGEARVHTLDGAVRLKIPPRTQADRTFRLRGKGMPRLGRPTEHGDLYARVRLVLPADLTDAEVASLRELAERRKA